MTITGPQGQIPIASRIRLPTTRPTFIPPLVYTTIAHDITVTGIPGLALILPTRGVFTKLGLWVGIEMVEDGPLVTVLFNMGQKRLRLNKGEWVSELVFLHPHRPWVKEKPEPLLGGPGLDMASELLQG